MNLLGIKLPPAGAYDPDEIWASAYLYAKAPVAHTYLKALFGSEAMPQCSSVFYNEPLALQRLRNRGSHFLASNTQFLVNSIQSAIFSSKVLEIKAWLQGVEEFDALHPHFLHEKKSEALLMASQSISDSPMFIETLEKTLLNDGFVCRS